jgi:hypothetical protein
MVILKRILKEYLGIELTVFLMVGTSAGSSAYFTFFRGSGERE